MIWRVLQHLAEFPLASSYHVLPINSSDHNDFPGIFNVEFFAKTYVSNQRALMLNMGLASWHDHPFSSSMLVSGRATNMIPMICMFPLSWRTGVIGALPDIPRLHLPSLSVKQHDARHVSGNHWLSWFHFVTPEKLTFCTWKKLDPSKRIYIFLIGNWWKIHS